MLTFVLWYTLIVGASGQFVGSLTANYIYKNDSNNMQIALTCSGSHTLFPFVYPSVVQFSNTKDPTYHIETRNDLTGKSYTIDSTFCVNSLKGVNSNAIVYCSNENGQFNVTIIFPLLDERESDNWKCHALYTLPDNTREVATYHYTNKLDRKHNVTSEMLTLSASGFTADGELEVECLLPSRFSNVGNHTHVSFSLSHGAKTVQLIQGNMYERDNLSGAIYDDCNQTKSSSCFPTLFLPYQFTRENCVDTKATFVYDDFVINNGQERSVLPSNFSTYLFPSHAKDPERLQSTVILEVPHVYQCLETLGGSYYCPSIQILRQLHEQLYDYMQQYTSITIREWNDTENFSHLTHYTSVFVGTAESLSEQQGTECTGDGFNVFSFYNTMPKIWGENVVKYYYLFQLPNVGRTLHTVHVMSPLRAQTQSWFSQRYQHMQIAENHCTGRVNININTDRIMMELENYTRSYNRTFYRSIENVESIACPCMRKCLRSYFNISKYTRPEQTELYVQCSAHGTMSPARKLSDLIDDLHCNSSHDVRKLYSPQILLDYPRTDVSDTIVIKCRLDYPSCNNNVDNYDIDIYHSQTRYHERVHNKQLVTLSSLPARVSHLACDTGNRRTERLLTDLVEEHEQNNCDPLRHYMTSLSYTASTHTVKCRVSRLDPYFKCPLPSNVVLKIGDWQTSCSSSVCSFILDNTVELTTTLPLSYVDDALIVCTSYIKSHDRIWYIPSAKRQSLTQITDKETSCLLPEKAPLVAVETGSTNDVRITCLYPRANMSACTNTDGFKSVSIDMILIVYSNETGQPLGKNNVPNISTYKNSDGIIQVGGNFSNIHGYVLPSHYIMSTKIPTTFLTELVRENMPYGIDVAFQCRHSVSIHEQYTSSPVSVTKNLINSYNIIYWKQAHKSTFVTRYRNNIHNVIVPSTRGDITHTFIGVGTSLVVLMLLLCVICIAFMMLPNRPVSFARV